MDDHAHDSTAVWTTLDRYLAGEASPRETAAIQAILARIPDAETILRLEPRTRSNITGEFMDHDSSRWAEEGITESWNAIADKLAFTDTAKTYSVPSPTLSQSQRDATTDSRSAASIPTRHISKPWATTHNILRISFASVAALCIAVAGWWSGAGNVRSSLSNHISTYSTPPGKQATVTLPDGTELFLNVDSKVQVAGDFMNGNRSVRLVGEALFTVVHHSGEPFVVITDSVRTKVLGTQFAVRLYPGDSTAIIAVREGRVAVENVVVASGEQLQIKRRNSSGFIVTPVKADRHNFIFADGIVAFDDVRLGDAAPELSRWYDTKIIFADESLKNLRISGEFSAKSIHDLIEVLEGTFKVKVTRAGNSVSISKR